MRRYEFKAYLTVEQDNEEHARNLADWVCEHPVVGRVSISLDDGEPIDVTDEYDNE